MITTNDAEVAARLRRLRQHAMSASDLVRHQALTAIIESYEEVGYNYRMTDLQAALGLIQLRRAETFLARRSYLAARYSDRLGSLGWLSLPKEPEGCRHNFQSYMVRMRANPPITRNGLMQKLLERGVGTRRGVMAIHRELPYRDARWDERLPETGRASDETLVLPLFHQMTEQEQDFVIDCIHDLGADRAT